MPKTKINGAHKMRIGRLPGDIVFEGKNIRTSVGLQSKLQADYDKAQKRTGKSFAEILHLVSWSSLTVNEVSKQSFEDWKRESGR